MLPNLQNSYSVSPSLSLSEEEEIPKLFSSLSINAPSTPANELMYKGILLPLNHTPRVELFDLIHQIFQDYGISYHAPTGRYYSYATPTPIPRIKLLNLINNILQCSGSSYLHAPTAEEYDDDEPYATPALTNSFHAPPGEEYSDDEPYATPTLTNSFHAPPGEYYFGEAFATTPALARSFLAEIYYDTDEDDDEEEKEMKTTTKQPSSSSSPKIKSTSKNLSKPKSAPATSNDVTREIEDPIEAAIAHCKRSQNSN